MSSADYTDPMQQLTLMKTARQNERADLQAVIDSHVGATASTVLAFNQHQLMTKLMDTDPNILVDSNDPSTPGDSPTDPTGPATGGSS